MLIFCPECSNLLTVTKYSHDDPDDSRRGKSRFECRTCPYEMPIHERWYERHTMKKKQVEDIMGGAKAWENVDKTAVQCNYDGCDGSEAYFRAVQIRSADEPSTLFYKCTKCRREWRGE